MLVSRRLKKNISHNYNTISINRFSSKTETWSDIWYFNDSILWKPFFSSAANDLLYSLKIQKNNYSPPTDWWKYTNLAWRRMLGHFPKSPPHKGNLYNKEHFKREITSIIENFARWLYQLHCAKSGHIRSYSGPYFPAFGLNTERYSESLCIQSECGKILLALNSFISGYVSKKLGTNLWKV